MLKKIFTFLFLLSAVLGATSANATSVENFYTSNYENFGCRALINTNANSSVVSLSDKNIYWVEKTGELHYYNIDTDTKTDFTPDKNSDNSDILSMASSGKKVVYFDTALKYLSLYDFGTTQVTHIKYIDDFGSYNYINQNDLVMNDDYIAWKEGKAENIMSYNISTGEIKEIGKDVGSASINVGTGSTINLKTDGKYFYWFDSSKDIVRYNPLDGEILNINEKFPQLFIFSGEYEVANDAVYVWAIKDEDYGKGYSPKIVALDLEDMRYRFVFEEEYSSIYRESHENTNIKINGESFDRIGDFVVLENGNVAFLACKNDDSVFYYSCQDLFVVDIESLKTKSIISTSGYRDSETRPHYASIYSSENSITAVYDSSSEDEIQYFDLSSYFNGGSNNEESNNKTDNTIGKRLAGKILLQTEDRGRIWYVNPETYRKEEVTFGTVMQVFRDNATGITNSDLYSIPTHPDSFDKNIDTDGDGFSDYDEAMYGYNSEIASNPNARGNDKVVPNQKLINRLKGRLLLQVEDRGRIWYVDFEGKRWEITWDNVMNVFRHLALGISNADLATISD